MTTIPSHLASDEKAADVDVSKGSEEDVAEGVIATHQELKRPLKPRHIQMIAIGGVIGTGLFLGTASNLENSGPAGLLLSYCIMASLLYSVMVALGEMIAEFPLPGGQFALANRFVSPELGFAMGWLYWFNNIVVLPAEISAAAVLVSYWTPASDANSTCTTGICSNAMWVGLMLIVVLAVNFAGTRVFGECEFWVGLIIRPAAVVADTSPVLFDQGHDSHWPHYHRRHHHSWWRPDGQAIGFRFWNETGGFVQYAGIAGAKGRFLGFFSVLIAAAFAFIGTEITAIAAAEAANPRKTVPRAIKSVWIRLVLFYILSAFIIGLLVSPSDPSLNLESTAAKSPFVIAIKNAGISVLPSIVNAALLTSAWSAACADLFVSSRALYGLTQRGHAPQIFAKLRKDGLPWVAVAFSALFSLLSFMAASSGSAGTVFGYFSSMTSLCGMISWACILWTSIRWHKALKVKGIDRKTLAYRAPFQPYLSYYGLGLALVVIVFGGFTSFIHEFDVSDFITTYITIVFFVALFVGYKLCKKGTGLRKYTEIDWSGSSVVVSEGPKKSFWKRLADNV